MTPAAIGAGSSPGEPFGVVVVDKPAGITSHDAVNSIRRSLSTRRVGHTGTLDPMATGVLVLCVGAATRLAEYVVSEPKEYLAEITFGLATDTLDITGRTTDEVDASELTYDAIAGALDRFRGPVDQVPPMVSALHVDGVRLYELARKGQTVDRRARRVTFHELAAGCFEAGRRARLQLRVVCSSGAYIRSLAADLGEAVGVCATLSALQRTRVGAFGLADAEPLAGACRVRPVADAIAPMARGEVSEADFEELATGRPIGLSAPAWRSLPEDGSLAFLQSPQRHRCAVCRRSGDFLQPAKVLGAATGRT